MVYNGNVVNLRLTLIKSRNNTKTFFFMKYRSENKIILSAV